MRSGQIKVQTENIFPIIKKFLYSDHEIFLRELVSNATDATSKLKVLQTLGEFKGNADDAKVVVSLDKENKTLTISDNGIGMTEEEIDRYINQIAFSGAEEFLEKYKDKEGTESIIGHFGLGFYSAFMVADRVQIRTKSYKEGSQPVMWESNGSPEYSISEIEKENYGTDIVLHIAEDSLEFLEESRIEGILNKYCKFLPVPVIFGTRTEYVDDPNGEKDDKGETKKVAQTLPKQVNNQKPAWTKAPSALTEEDYKKFYRELYPYSFDEPLFHIHLNVDYPFNLTGILYFPKLKENVEVQKNKINLYSNQVFISDDVKEIVPDFLTLLHGVIDSPDIPLNVSRSYLQSDGNVKKIANHITKKVASKLEEMFNKDRTDFEQKWDELKLFVEYGILTNETFAEKANAFTLLKNTESQYFTIDQYKEKVKPFQTDKNNKIVFLYASDVNAQYGFVQSAKEKAYDVLLLNSPLTAHWISKVEQENSDISFARVDSDTLDKLIEKESETFSVLSAEEEEKLKPIFENAVDKNKFHVVLENMSSTEMPVIITQSEFMRRMQEQQKMGGGGMFGSLPEMFNLAVNKNHPLISEILKEENEAVRSRKVSQVTDLAMLAQGMLDGEKLNTFIKNNLELLQVNR